MFKRIGVLAAAATAAVVSSSAFAAAGDLSAAITTELADGKGEILIVGGIVLGLVGVVLLISMVKRSAKG
jgi:ammonia channel protein AmtB